MPALSWMARLYVALVLVSGAVLVAVAVWQLDDTSAWVTTAWLVGLCAVGTSKAARGTHDRAAISVGSIAIVAGVLLVDVWGTVLTAVGVLFSIGTHANLLKRLFNGAQFIVAAAAAAVTFHALGGEVVASSFSLVHTLLPFMAAGLVLCGVNGALVAGIVSLTQGIPMRSVWRGTMAHSAVPYVGYGLFGLMLAILWEPAGIGPLSALLLLLPLYIARWAYAQYAEEQDAYDRTVRTLIAAVETKDVYTRGHSERVAAASVMIAREIKMSEDRVATLRYAGMLHDVGKLGVPTRVLQKSTQLTDEEYEAIKLHPMRGHEMIREIEFLGEAFDGIMHHHERLDGRGYPMGLKGDEIPEFARVIAVADAFDSMTTTRSYRGARSADEAMDELRRCAAHQFEPAMVEALIASVRQHGWEVEREPAFDVRGLAVDGEPPPLPAYDHDDPTVDPVSGSSPT